MRIWVACRAEMTCGACGGPIMPGMPILQLALPSLKHPKLRCAECASEPVPALISKPLAPPVHVSQEIPTMTRLRDAAPYLDWKQKASGS